MNLVTNLVNAQTSLTSRILLYKSVVNSTVTTQTAAKSITPTIVGARYSELADILKYTVDSLRTVLGGGVTLPQLDDSMQVVRDSLFAHWSAIQARLKYSDSSAMLGNYIIGGLNRVKKTGKFLYLDTTLCTISDLTNYTEAYNKYTVSGSYSAGTITFTRKDLSTWTVTGLATGTGTVTSLGYTAGYSILISGTNPVTNTGTWTYNVDSFLSASRLRVQKAVDSINATIPSSTVTFTNKRFNPRILTTTNFTTSVTINGDSYDGYAITAQAGALLFNEPSGTPVHGQILVIDINDDGSARALTYNAKFRGTAPSTTVVSKTLTMVFKFNTISTDYWDFMFSVTNP